MAVILSASILSAQLGTVPPIKFHMMDGKTVKLESLTKKGIVLIDYWALWCAPCLNKMPYLDKLQKEFSSMGLKIIGVNIDSERSVSKVKSYVRSKGYVMSVALDPSKETYRFLNGVTIPYTLLINSDGRILYRHSGYAPGDETLIRNQIQMALKSSTKYF